MKARLTLKTYTIVLVITGMIVLVTAGVRISQNTTTIVQSYALASNQFARNELKEALHKELSEMEEVARNYATWDETAPNFYNTKYYTYWRDVRSAQLPGGRANVTAVELYRPTGESLSAERNAMLFSKLPPRIQELAGVQTGVTFLVSEGGRADNGKVMGYVAHAVTYLDARKPVGYVVVKAPIEEILHAMSYRYINGIAFEAVKEGEYYLPEQIEAKIKVGVRQNPELEKLSELNANAIMQYSTMVVIFFIIIAVASYFLIVHPMRKLATVFRESQDDTHADIDGQSFRGSQIISEISDFIASVNSYRRRIRSMHERIASQNRKLEDMAYHDPLTGVHNRRAMDVFVQDLRNDPDIADMPLSLVLIDCDEFKMINDTYGHKVGDDVLVRIAKATGAVLRRGDRLFRIGGDEFVVILPTADAEQALRVSNRIYDSVSRLKHGDLGLHEPVIVSVGVATTERINAADVDMLKAQADIAMYGAKHSGDTKVVMYSASMEGTSTALSIKAIGRVVEAVNDRTMIEMYYQDIVPLDTGTGCMEALVRIIHENDLLTPEQIFPIVKMKHIQVEMDTVILKSITHDIEQDIIPRETGVSINVHPYSLEDTDFMKQLQKTRETCKDRELIVEIAESVVVADPNGMAKKLELVSKLGYRIALDNFGRGHATILPNISSYPISIVKFDKSLIHHLGEGSGVFAAPMAATLREMKYTLVAEGVETEESLAEVRKLGFHYAQGFLFSRPERLQTRTKVLRFTELLRQRK